MDNRIVHLIDDDEDVRRAVAFMLGTTGLAVRVYESASAFLAQDGRGLSGCIVSDVRMPGVDGLGLMRALKERGQDIPVVIMTGHADVPLAVEAMKAGAVDFIEKPFTDDAMLAAVAVALGRAGTGRDSGLDDVRSRMASLTPREREVLDGLLAGHPNKTIASDLGLSPRTVEVHRANVMTKMCASSLSELVRQALLAGAS
ncbi:MAG TPA: response regulator FixJ [Rhizomicrobium sp.]|jgi:two-component system response regulator FixJ|nr:response regulator FixJ [Rhizomicrobium sp.]